MTQSPALQDAKRISKRFERWLTPERFLLALVLATTFVAYAGTLGYDFVLDDHEQIVANPYVRSWRYFPHFFTEALWHQFSTIGRSNYYRPLFQVWLRVNYALFGLATWGWHLSTVLVHVAVTLLLFRLARRLSSDGWTAILVAMVFGLHPVHAEAVAWVSGVPEPLLALFLIAGFLCHLNWRAMARNGRGWRGAALLLFALALLSKETALVFPFLVLAYEWVTRPGSGDELRRRSWVHRLRAGLVSLWPYFALEFVYLGIRVKIIGALGEALTPLPWSTMILTWPSLLWFYIRHLVWPIGLSYFYDTPYVSHADPTNFAAPLAAIALAGIGLGWFSRKSHEVRIASAWLLFPFLPLLDIQVFSKGDLAHDRYLYLPSVGVSILAAVALRRLNFGRTLLPGVPAVQVCTTFLLACALGFATAYESRIWANDWTLSIRGVAVAPNNPFAWNNLGRAWADRGFLTEAEKFFLKSVELEPGFSTPNFNLGLLYFQQRRLVQAEWFLGRTVTMNPYDSRGYMQLGKTEMELGRLEEAASLLRRAIELGPDVEGYHLALGTVFKMQGNLSAALGEFKAELANYPENSAAREQVREIKLLINKKQSERFPAAGPPGSRPNY